MLYSVRYSPYIVTLCFSSSVSIVFKLVFSKCYQKFPVLVEFTLLCLKKLRYEMNDC